MSDQIIIRLDYGYDGEHWVTGPRAEFDRLKQIADADQGAYKLWVDGHDEYIKRFLPAYPKMGKGKGSRTLYNQKVEGYNKARESAHDRFVKIAGPLPPHGDLQTLIDRSSLFVDYEPDVTV